MTDRGGRLSERIYGRIIELIISEGLDAGERLPAEGALATRLGVSRPVIREALSRLVSDGIVETRQGSGSFVRVSPAQQLTHYLPGDALAQIIGIFELRMALEPVAAALAAARRSDAQLEALEHALGELKRTAETREAAQDIDQGFHLIVVQASANTAFEDAYRAVSEGILKGMRAGLAISRADDMPVTDVEEHAAIFRAIRARDGDAASLSMRWHLHCSRQRLINRSSVRPS
ncbi:FadR/GntR family transcriptional regulator [Stakelama saccharophila]|uniref:FadR/GntR family transcriptional regulator n=1 Tax=Stakelama saccharophila TaxID=3075605 RepID=A0ABZ0B4X3_9SPHN|nr:FadR/GntR family transcriptional regulator [Stakelama sp. W311]WNO52423.1 FadR/GntR family transcriptional regulator [Stakelama sp. W311]